MGRSSYQQSLRKAVYFPLINVNLYFDIATVFLPGWTGCFHPREMMFEKSKVNSRIYAGKILC